MLGRDDPGDDSRDIRDQRAAGVMLHPLAEVEVGVLMSVMIRSSQLVVNPERSRQRSDAQEDQREGNRQPHADTPAELSR